MVKDYTSTMASPPPPSRAPSPPHADESFSRSWILALAACFLLLGLLASRKIWDTDLGIYLGAGKWIVQNHGVPAHDVFTYTVPDHPYLEVQWAFDLLALGLYRAGGYPLLSFFNVVLIALAFACSWARLGRTHCPRWLGVPLLAAVVLACEFRFHLRAENLSWALLVGMLWVLELYVDRGKNLLFLPPLLEILWVNTEGIFPIGWAVVALFLLSAWIRAKRVDARLLSCFLLVLLAVLWNPYGYHILRVPLAIWETLHADVFTRNITEFLSPWDSSDASLLPPGLWGYKSFSVLLLLGMAATFRHRRLRDWLLAGFFFYLSARSVRNIPLFLLACLPTAGEVLRDLSGGRLGRWTGPFLSSPRAAALWTALMLGLGARVVTNAFYVSAERPEHFGWGLDLDRIPERAVEFISQNHLDGRILNDIPCGDWLDWRGPQKIFLDGRLQVMGSDLFAQYTRTRQPGGLLSLADHYGADILIFTLPNHWVNDLAKATSWRPVYADGTAALYLREGYAPQVPALQDAQILRQEGVSNDILAQAPGLLRLSPAPAWEAFGEGFFRKEDYPYRLAHLGVFLFLTGHPAGGEAFYLEAIRRGGGRYGAFYFNLGQFYYLEGRAAEAGLCMRRVLQEDPGNGIARRILESLPLGSPGQP